jgi:hypothetical protein
MMVAFTVRQLPLASGTVSTIISPARLWVAQAEGSRQNKSRFRESRRIIVRFIVRGYCVDEDNRLGALAI